MPVVAVVGALRAEQVMEDTWGHLRAPTGVHEGKMVVACSGRDYCVVSSEIEDEHGSPWLHEAMHDYIAESVFSRSYWSLRARRHIERPAKIGVYEWCGTLRVHKNGKMRFAGKWTKMVLSTRKSKEG